MDASELLVDNLRPLCGGLPKRYNSYSPRTVDTYKHDFHEVELADYCTEIRGSLRKLKK